MKPRKYSDIEKQIFTPDEIANSERWARAEAEAIDLRELRQLLGISQADLAARIGKDQPELSRLERRRDVKLSTLTRFVRALGGELELTARFGNKLLVLAPAWLDDSDQPFAEAHTSPLYTSPARTVTGRARPRTRSQTVRSPRSVNNTLDPSPRSRTA